MSEVYGCPKCGNTSVIYDYGLRAIICEKCKALAKDFKPLSRKTKSKSATSS
ncbi:MAG: hypothetical protein OEY88_09825 [Candidatus Bathyarchaeota archaeon]|nr:hypothetical protein [Candidatus Bathyarchaeota archaeon]